MTYLFYFVFIFQTICNKIRTNVLNICSYFYKYVNGVKLLSNNIFFVNDEHFENFINLMEMYHLKPGQDLEYEANIFICSHPDLFKCFNLKHLNLDFAPACGLLEMEERDKHNVAALTSSTRCLLQVSMSLYNGSEISLSTILNSVTRPDLFKTMVQAISIRANSQSELPLFNNVSKTVITSNENDDLKELIAIAYQAVTMTSPTEDILGLLSHCGIKRALEILLCIKQSPSPVRNFNRFIEKAIINHWSPSTNPIKKQRKVSRIRTSSQKETRTPPSVPFYNWLEEE